MKNNQKYKLIDGSFTAEDADRVVSNLLNYKIDYHCREDFSNHIRYNKEIEHSKKRIQELTETKEQIKNLIQDFKSENIKFIIKSNISIEIEK
jgi:glucosamine 6-phosphate synthetase-like amidotransferase/phosphosugar isomerase protein